MHYEYFGFHVMIVDYRIFDSLIAKEKRSIFIVTCKFRNTHFNIFPRSLNEFFFLHNFDILSDS